MARAASAQSAWMHVSTLPVCRAAASTNYTRPACRGGGARTTSPLAHSVGGRYRRQAPSLTAQPWPQQFSMLKRSCGGSQALAQAQLLSRVFASRSPMMFFRCSVCAPLLAHVIPIRCVVCIALLPGLWTLARFNGTRTVAHSVHKDKLHSKLSAESRECADQPGSRSRVVVLSASAQRVWVTTWGHH